MSEDQRFTAWLIGDLSLLVHCAEHLLDQRHTVFGIITEDREVRRWAESKDLPASRPDKELAARLRARPYDYLFSIGNLKILGDDVLATPRKTAINFHDGPLPKYAGLNATTWALIAGEDTHGITWHEMTAKVDQGEILQQERFEIAAQDTSFTLNAKCYEAAIRSFQQLVADIERGRLQGRPQPRLQTLHYFSKSKRPAAAATLSWKASAEQLESLVRALDFGPYANPIGLPKIACGNDLVLVREVATVDVPPSGQPGTVAELEPEAVCIRTAAGVLKITKVTTAAGAELPVSDWVQRWNLKPGMRLPELDPALARRLSELHESSVRAEAFWARRFATLEPIQPPYAKKVAAESASANYQVMSLALPAEANPVLRSEAEPVAGTGLLAAFVGYLARVGGKSRFDLALSTARLRALTEGVELWFSPRIPLHCVVDEGQGFESLTVQVNKWIERTALRQTYRQDLRACLPELRGLGVCESIGIELQQPAEAPLTGQTALTLRVQADGVSGCWIYDARAWDKADVEAIQKQLGIFLTGIAQHPDRPLADIDLVEPAERQRLLVDWNRTTQEFPAHLCIQQLFERQVQRTPGQQALAFRERTLSYDELNARSNKLAHHLRSLGVGPESLVGIALERSIEMLVAIIGTLKAGGAYVPLDPDYPTERLAFMLEDSEAAVLLTQQALLERLPTGNAHVVRLDSDWQRIEQQPHADPPARAGADNLAYVIYTSGSTGRPKGVQVSHRALVNFLRSMGRRPGIASSDRLLAVTTLSFDISKLEIFLPLMQGAQLRLASRQDASDPGELARLLAHGTSLMQATPATWRMLMESGWEGSRDLTALCGGEALPQGLADWLARRVKCVWNMYGPTETTIWSAVHRLESGQGSVSIGRPIANTQIYILDQAFRPVPVGVAGQLHIGGAGLSRGYLKRSQLTAEKFVPDPFSQEPGARLYKTGDLCRWRADGNLEFLGRLDHQVKIRGHRIELGEIESALLAHDQVREAVVLAREDQPGDKRLVAYAAPSAETAVSPTDLREHLQAGLPPYMLPSAFVVLESLPLTPNGKLDRKALPAPDGHPQLDDQYVPPRSPVEEQLCAIWQEVLHLERVGVQDNFFRLGGHSLLATQVISRVRGAFQVELPMAALFACPTVTALAQALQRRWSAGAATVQVPELAPQQRGEAVPLSFAQQRLWFLDQLLPDSPQYNMPIPLRLRGPLDRRALERAFQQLVQRHEALRTRFESVDGQPRQVIEADWVQPLSAFQDLRPLSAAERETEVLRRVQREAFRPFDLSRGPLLRVHLWRLSDQEHALLLNMHHIVSDGWSMGVLTSELSALYAAFTQGKPDPLPPLPVQYADYAIWQRGWLRGEVLEGQLNYWRDKLSGAEVLELPTDHPRPAVSAGRGATVDVRLPQSLSEGLKQLCLEQEVSLFMLLLSAFQVLLSRYAGQKDIVVGAPIANRTQRRTEGLIGIFINTLALRNDLSGDPRFSGLLGQVRRRTLADYAHQDLPFEQLVDALELERDLSRESLVQVMFVWENTPRGELELDGLSLQPVPLEQTTAKLDLTLSLGEGEAGLSGSLEYRSDLFERETIERMAGHLLRLLEGTVSAPECRLSELPLLTEGERRQLLVEWNDTAADHPRDRCIHHLFEEQVQRTPEAAAVLFEDRQLTYAQLNARANRLAHRLRQMGVGPEVLAGICVERSLEMVVGVLGILKAGGAYVPLDPDYPAERLAFMLEDAQSPLLLTQQALLERVPAHGAHVVCLDSDWQQIEQQPDDNLPTLANAENLAYIIYTSGSTGTPKGVAIEHRSAAALIHWARRVFSDEELAGVLFSTSVCFDLSIFEMFVPLAWGGSVIVAANALALPELPAADQVTLFNSVPSAITELLRRGHLPESIQTVNLAGEVLTARLAKRIYEEPAVRRVYDLFGPSEDTTYSTFGLRMADGPYTIGRPVANSQVYLLDEHQHPVPVGVPGEMYLGGAGLARGYLNRPELNAARFVPDPFSSGSSNRLYRSGDLARYLPDGNIEFLGRSDRQVKIHGFRIELGEIETALGAHASIKDLAVLAREDVQGQKRLVAYLVWKDKQEKVTELRRSLMRRLPTYMVPSVFVTLEELPLTPNGKVNRLALPAPDNLHPDMQAEYLAPRNPAEERLCAIWQEVLNLERVGVQDNFFHLGGDSILSIQVIARAGGQGLRLTARQVFEHQTIAALAEVARQRVEIQAEQGLVRGEAQLTPIQHWFFEQDLADAHHWNQAVLLRPAQRLCAKTLQQAAQRLLQQHDALRLRFNCEAASWRQSFTALQEAFAVERVDLSQVEDSHQARELEQRAGRIQASLDLEQGPLWRMTLFDSGADRPQRLLIAIHHLAVDGVSWRILLEDLGRLYAQAAAGERLRLPAKTSSLQQWAERLQQYAQSDDLLAELDYWQDVVRTGPAAFPVDDPRGDNTVGSAQTISTTFSQERTKALLREVPAAYQTQINDVLLTALLQAYAAWSGQDSLVLDLEGHGREELFADLDVSRTVGWFTTIYPLRLESPDAASAEVSLKVVKEQLRAVPQRGIGYGVLRYLSEHPQADALRAASDAALSFNYLGQFETIGNSGLGEVTAESAGPSRSPHGQCRHLIEVNGIVSGGRLRMDWTYSGRLRRATVAALAEHFQEKLSALIEHCVSAQAGGYTPSDFPLSGLGQRQLDRLIQPQQARNQAIEDIYPLSGMQQGMLYHTLREPDSGVYYEQFVFELEGGLEMEAFAQAWRQVQSRHAVLRTTFLWQGVPQMLQVVHRRQELPFGCRDWRERDAERQRQDLESHLASRRSEGFDLEAGPLWGVELIRQSETSWWCVFCSHHALWDGWSVPVILQEVLQGYQAAFSGRRLSLPAARPYREYIAWLGRQDHEAAEAFWREQLAGLTSATPLGVERVLEGVEPGPQEVALPLDAALSDRLRRFARRHRLTLNTLLQGSWGLLLSRYSGQEDVIFGATTSGRPAELAGVERMVGLFINTLPVRVRAAQDDRVEDWLSQLQERQLAARQFEHCSLVDLQGWSEVPAGSPLFESLLVFENYPVSDELRSSQWGELRLGRVESHEQTNYPLAIAVAPGAEVGLGFQYDRSRFERETIERMAGHLQQLLEGIVAAPECRLSRLPLLTDSELQQLLIEWNGTAADYPRDRCLHQLFEEQARRTPEAAAVAFGDRQLTYAQLNARANRLARHLRELGVGPEVLAAICVERSLEMAVGLLGILKAGGAYVPLDPDYPAERLAFMLEDSQAPVLLTQQALLERLPARRAQVVCLDGEPNRIDRQPDDDLPAQARPHDLAYVIYTSGSTGNPKGVMVQHQGVVNLAFAQMRFLAIDRTSRVLLFASLSFDASVWEIFAAWLAGARLCLASREDSLPGSALAQTADLCAATHLTLPPSALQAMPAESLKTCRVLVVAGEDCRQDLMRQWSSGRSMHNAYGPTEVTVCATISAPLHEAHRLNMGRPIANAQAYVLDRAANPVAQGVIGELSVAGAGLARGYLNRPGLTADRFIPDPFSQEPGSRLYKTGDLCRWLADGNLEFLGRSDHQVKIRGHRIELGEIESALAAHDAVREAVVLAREDQPGEKRLAAYVAHAAETTLSPAALREHLQALLPSYMLPSAFVVLESLPLTPNGKLDRKALPAPDGRLQLDDQYLPPRNPAEEQLCAIWQEVLRLERVGVQDNFFHLGGHSLLATQVISRVLGAFQVELPMAALFAGPTVAELAQALLRQRSAGAATVEVPELAPQQRGEAVPLSFAQQRLWFLDQLLPDSPQYNVTGLLRLQGRLDRAALERAFQQLVQRHEALRTRFESVDGQPRQVIQADCVQPLSAFQDLRPLSAAEREEEVLRRAQQEASRPFDLSRGPLLRVHLWQLSDQEHALLLNTHHIVSDGWSIGVLISELSLLYSAFCDGDADPLPPLPVQYADYAIWQRGWLRGDVLEGQLSYWREQLSGAEVLELPTDHPRPAVSAGRGGSVEVRLPKSLGEGLKQLCLEQEVSLFMLLLSAFQVLLSRHSDQKDIVVGAPIANRTQRRTEGLIGFFVNTLALRSDLSGDPPFVELLGRVRERTLTAYAHQDLPFEQLVDAMELERDLSRESLVQVMFAWQNALQGESELGELRLQPVPLEHTTAKFDLTLLMGESEAGLSGSLEYRSDLFEPETIERMVGRLLRLLEGIVSAPQSRLSELPLLTEGERRQLLVEWNDTAADYPRDRCIQQLFEEQVRRTPEAAAVVFEDRRLTYAQLNARANRLAHRLAELGVGPEVPVGICAERSLEMVVGLLGILKAGGAYAPLDPDYPAERLAFMLEDSQAPVLLTQQAVLERLPADNAQVIRLDADWERIERQPQDNPPAQANAENLAYVIYTSGSTGRPKGVAMRHGALSNLIRWQIDDASGCLPACTLQFTSLSFDVSFQEVFSTWCAGGTLVMIDEQRRRDSRALLQYIREQRIERLFLPFVALQHLALCSTEQEGEASPLSHIITAGEQLHATSELREFLQQNPDCRLHNHYGPTESHVATSFTLPLRSETWDEFPSIGRPLANAQTYVLDRDREPAPVGVSGDLYLGGECLARGYLNRPQLTAEKFVPNPFSETPGSRLYKTGDLCRWRPDGNLEFLGRSDHQVKIRGHRIELGEIESALLTHDAIREAAVLAREDQPGEKRLAAYVAIAADRAVSPTELREHLQAGLPRYMLPSAFVFLESLPLTPNGKLDRRSLPATDGNPDLDDQFVPPRNPVEEQLCAIWQEVLHLERVGVQDNFFHLGGHSLLATQVISRVRGEFQVELPVAALFTGPTVAELEACLDQLTAVRRLSRSEAPDDSQYETVML